MVYLTATLLLREEEEFYELTHIPRDHEPIRGYTSRPNVRYQVRTIEIRDREDLEDVFS